MTAKKEEGCALCQEVRPLRDSHIIPEFLHGPLYDEKHRFNTYGQDGSPETGLEQKGQRERLLCDECEQRFSDHERWVTNLFRGAIAAFSDTTRSEMVQGKSLKFTRIGTDAHPTTATVPSLLLVEGVDYVRLKLFLLSLLWRMGVSSLHFFREVELGPHEKKIRMMLINDDPGEPHDYPCQLRLIEADNRLLSDFQSQPRKYRLDGRTFYRLYSTGIRFDFCVSNRPIHPGDVELYCVKRQSDFIWCVDSVRKHPDLVAELLKLGQDLNLGESERRK
jgi:hypothetical protein